MLESKIRWSLIILNLVIVCGVFFLLGCILVDWKKQLSVIEMMFEAIGGLFFLIMATQMIFGELRNNATKLILRKNSIVEIKFFGFGKKREYDYATFDGYITSMVPGGKKDHEYLYLISDNKKVIKIAEFYHLNYEDLKSCILTKNVKHLGDERYSILKNVRETFSFKN